MANEQDRALAVKVAGEAVRSGDAESIGDAQVGLVAQGLEGHVVFQQLATAASLLDPARALRDAPGEAAFMKLLVELWSRRAFEAVAFGLALLGVKASEAQLRELEGALATVNGKRRAELIFPTDVFSVVLDVRHGAASSRRPVDDRGWRKKTTTRSVCALERQGDGTLRLEVGTEQVASYAAPVRSTTALSLTLDPAPPPALPSAAPVIPAPALHGERAAQTEASSLPLELSTRLTALLRGEPSDSRFDGLLDVLVQHRESPHLDAAVALVARSLARWPDEHRRPRWSVTLTPQLMRLVRVLGVNLGALLDYASMAPSLDVREVRLIGLEGGDRPSLPQVFDAFPGVRTLGLPVAFAEPGSPAFELLARLRFPPRLERLALRHDLQTHSAWSEAGLSTLVPRLIAECPLLTQLEVRHGRLAPLAGLPEKIELSVFGLSRPGDATRLAQALPGRSLGTLVLSTWPGAAEEVLATELAGHVTRLRVDTTPGELERLLERPWPKLKALSVTLPAQHARMHRKKPPDYSFTRGDIEALAASGFASQLESLDLCGLIGEELAGVLVGGLARAKPRLERLTLNAGEIGNEALAAFAEAGLLAGVRHLELFRCRLKGSGLTALLGEQGPRQLSTLVLAKNAATQQAIEALSAWPGLTSVARLDLREVTLSPAQRACLEASPHLQPDALDLSDASFW